MPGNEARLSQPYCLLHVASSLCPFSLISELFPDCSPWVAGVLSFLPSHVWLHGQLEG